MIYLAIYEMIIMCMYRNELNIFIDKMVTLLKISHIIIRINTYSNKYSYLVYLF
jgi:hypothetical protein